MEEKSVIDFKNEDICIHPFYSKEDILLASQMESVKFLSEDFSEINNKTIENYAVNDPDDAFGFLHEAAIIEYKGVLYASWYNNTQFELNGYTPICERRSYDGGKSWTEMQIIADDKSGEILYCPPVYAICDDKLYMFMNQMVGADLIHSFDLYVLNEETDKFEFLWSRPIPFKLNTNAVTLPNGKLLLPGRIAELDGFPNTPAVLISDSGKVDAEWRLVKIAPNGDLPDGEKLVHPEISVICCEDTLYMFSRNDERVVPLVYISKDFGESWSKAMSHDIPYVSSKMYCGTLKSGENFIVANTESWQRTKLEVFLSKKDKMQFDRKLTVFDASNNNNHTLEGVQGCHYPCAIESDGKLYVIATKNVNSWIRRGAELFVIDINDLN